MARLLALVIGTTAALAFVTSASAEQGSQAWLQPVTGEGTGRVILSPTAQEHGELYVQGQVEVEGVSPNATMSVMRALFSDGTCTTITKPWASVAPGSFTTSAGGAGTMHFIRDTSNLSGTTLYTEFRVSGGGDLLQTNCFSVFIK